MKRIIRQELEPGFIKTIYEDGEVAYLDYPHNGIDLDPNNEIFNSEKTRDWMIGE